MNFLKYSKKAVLTLIFAVVAIGQSFAGYIPDSDISNSAGTNEGRVQTGMYIFIVFLLVLSVIVGYLDKKHKAKHKA